MMSNHGMWLALADLTLVLHAAYVLFVIGGQLLILLGWGLEWMWTRRFLFRLLHLLAIGFVMLEAWLGVTCPLTLLESKLRERAGDVAYNSSFISYWLDRLIFYVAPEWIFIVIYTVFALLVILTWVFYPPRRNIQ